MSKDDGLVDFIAYIFFGVGGTALPYVLDIDFLGVLLPEFLTKLLPGIDKIDYSKMGLVQWGFVLSPIIFDREWWKIGEKFGILSDPFADALAGIGDQGSYVDEDGNIVMADGGVRNRSSGGSSLGGGASKIIKILAIGVPIIIVLFLGVSFIGGGGYTDFLAKEAAFQAGGLDASGIGATLAQAGKTVECFGNVACVRQWQFNNTQRPGSEERGQEYSLEIEDFGVNDGFPIDVANRRANDRVPVDFSVYNPRHGLKGITARNVAYRVKVYEGLGGLTGAPECETEWKPLGGEYAGNDFEGKGTILPGGFATPLGIHENLDLKECGLLQPALGIKRTAKLEVAYDYSSQATLQVDAMSWENMRSLEKRPTFKKSKTADTPVKTYLNVEAPITYRINKETGKPQSSIFTMKVGFETGSNDVKYKVDVEDFEVYDSSKTIDVASSDEEVGTASCTDLQREEGDKYTFSKNMKNFLKGSQEDSWFKSGAGPSPARCSFVIQDPGSISPTGETLTMRIDANYTVKLEERVTGFKVHNSRCTQYNCPMLVPQSVKESQSSTSYKSDLISECESDKRLDANDGCDARLGINNDNWRQVRKANHYDNKIEEGETAYLWKYSGKNLNTLKKRLSNQKNAIFKNAVFSNGEAIGLKKENVRKLEGKEATVDQYAEIVKNDNDVYYQKLDRILCNDYSVEEFYKIRNRTEPGEIAYFNPDVEPCGQDDLTDYIAELYTWTLYESPSERYDDVKNGKDGKDGCGGVVVVTESGFECYN